MPKKTNKEDVPVEANNPTTNAADVVGDADVTAPTVAPKARKTSSKAKLGSVSRAAPAQTTSRKSAKATKAPRSNTAVARVGKKPSVAKTRPLDGRKTRQPSAKTALRLLIGSVDKLLASKNSAFQQAEQGQGSRLAASMERIKLQTARYETAKVAAIQAFERG